ncbi:MAG: lysylphosphatidylglycerol synthase domain-containing protein, partial [bacterium]|nr:lysylphosphatidylglycerol synthase domain-containing protein [bacterium]
MTNSRLRTATITILKLGVVTGLLWYLIDTGRLQWEYLRVPDGNYGYIALATVMILAVYTIGFIRFKYVLKGADVHIGYLDSFRIGSIGLLFTIFALGLLTGDAARLTYVIKETNKRAQAVAGLMVDRFIGLLGLLTVGGLTLVLNWQTVLQTPALHTMSLAVTGLFAGLGFSGFIVLVSLTKGRRSAAFLWLIVSACTMGLLYWTFSDQGVAFFTTAETNSSSPALLRGRLVLVLGIDFIIALICLLIAPELTKHGKIGSFIAQRIPLGGKFMSLIDSLFGYRGHFSRVLGCLFISVCIHLLLLGTLLVLCRAVDMDPTPTAGQVFFAGAPSYVAGTLPLPVGALGVGET